MQAVDCRGAQRHLPDEHMMNCGSTGRVDSGHASPISTPDTRSPRSRYISRCSCWRPVLLAVLLQLSLWSRPAAATDLHFLHGSSAGRASRSGGRGAGAAAAQGSASGATRRHGRMLHGGEAPSSSLSSFETAYAATYSSGAHGDILKTITQFSGLLTIIAASRAPNHTNFLTYVPEMHSMAVQEVVASALKLAGEQGTGDDAKFIESLNYISISMDQLSPKSGYPAARRIVLGMLLKKRLDYEHGFPSSIQAVVDKVMLQLFMLHKRSAAAKGIVQFFHISKSGGTNLCGTAGANGCTSEGFDEKHNCLVKEFNDIPRWVTYNAHKYVQYRITNRQAVPWFVNFHTYRQGYDCAARAQVLRQNNWNFYANEYSNPPSLAGGSSQLLCKEFVNLLLFRNPYDRLKSQISWIQKLYKEFYVEVDTKRAFQNRTAGFWERLIPAGVNNYYIRSVLGQRYFEYPIVHVLQDHVLIAKLATLQYDILLDLDNKEFNDMSVRVALGWEQQMAEAQLRSSGSMAEEVCLPVDYDLLLQHNTPDMELFAFVKELHTMDVLLWQFVVAHDKATKSNNLATDKCGYVSMGPKMGFPSVAVPSTANGTTSAAPAAARPSTAAGAQAQAASSSDVEPGEEGEEGEEGAHKRMHA